MNDGVSGVDLVVEAATENMDVKLKIFSQLDEVCGENVILASNTSSISITKIASVTNRADKVIGMHFMNPVPVMKLVEIIRGYATSDDVTNSIMKVSKSLNKVPVEVNDYPGFATSRLGVILGNEAIKMLSEGVASASDIDTAMKLGYRHPMGPLELSDLVGLDVRRDILNNLAESFGDPSYLPHPLLEKLVQSGDLGKKTGRGIYTWDKDGKSDRDDL